MNMGYFIPSFSVKKYATKGVALLMSIVVVALVLLHRVGPVSADVATFFPETCLGGWQNPQYAANTPNVVAGLAEEFTENNSATIVDTISQLFCGEFSGEIPENAIHKKVTLKFSWALASPESEATDTASTTPAFESSTSTNATNGSPDYTGAPAAVSVPLLSEALATSTETSVENSIVEQVVVATSTISDGDTVSAPSEADLDSSEVPSTADDMAESAEPGSPEFTSTTESAPAEPASAEPVPDVSFFQQYIFRSAHAQETESGQQENINVVATPSADTASSTAATASTSVSEIPAGSILEVRYTVDGEHWESLGYVSRLGPDVSFEIPVSVVNSIATLSNVQIALHTLSSIDTVPMIYVDAMWLDIEYEVPREVPTYSDEGVASVSLSVRPAEGVIEIIEPEYLSDVSSTTPPASTTEGTFNGSSGGGGTTNSSGISGGNGGGEANVYDEDVRATSSTFTLFSDAPASRVFSAALTVDANAEHSCAMARYHIDISAVSQAETRVILRPDGAGPYTLTIGSLPGGIDLRFIEGDPYQYQPRTEEFALNMMVYKSEHARIGDFNVPIIYTKKGAQDSSVICKLNIINQ